MPAREGIYLQFGIRAFCVLLAVFRASSFISYNLNGGYPGMNRQELIIMLTVLVVGVCIIILILLNGL